MVDTFSILVVDDNPSMATAMEDILIAKGYQTYMAHSGKEALTVLKEHRVDILLTDVKMPDMDGVILYRKAKKMQPKMTTIFMTAYAADNLIQQGMAEGIKTVLTKPVDIDFLLLLLSTINKVSQQ